MGSTATRGNNTPRACASVKATAERLAQEDDRSLANWLERMIEAEAARQDGKK